MIPKLQKYLCAKNHYREIGKKGEKGENAQENFLTFFSLNRTKTEDKEKLLQFYKDLLPYCSKGEEFTSEKAIKALEISKCSCRTEKFHFSFLTKLFHMINNNLPIYDRFVRKALDLPSSYCRGSWEEKVNRGILCYKQLNATYQYLLQPKRAAGILPRIKNCIGNPNISSVKLIDFYIWKKGRSVKKLKKGWFWEKFSISKPKFL